MAHKILGIELGAYSVKVVVATAGFRSVTITDYIEAPVPAGDGPAEERAAYALGKLLRAHGLEHDVPYAALPGDGLSMRVLDFGFTGLKRADLDKAIGAELEAQLPHDLDELVYDFEVLPPDVREGGGVRHETGGGGAAGRDGVTDPAFVAGAGAAGGGGGRGGGGRARPG